MAVSEPEPSLLIDQLMRRYHYGSVASLLSEPAELINDFLTIMEVEGRKAKEERDKIERPMRHRRR